MKKPQIIAVNKDLSIPWFEQIEKTIILPDDPGEHIFYSIKPSDYVAILAQTTNDKIIIVRQYRPAIEDFAYELPSGHIEDGESPEQAIKRELQEETNCLASDVILLGETYPDTGRLGNRQWAFFASNVVIDELPVPEDNEGIEVQVVSIKELLEMIKKGQFKHALDLSVLALAISKQYLEM